MNGYELRRRRVELGLNQSELARRLGVSQAYLSLWEKGDRFPSSQTSLRAEALLKPARLDAVTNSDVFKAALGALGYPGFAYMAAERVMAPEQLLVQSLDCDELDTRVVEALPFVLLRYVDFDLKALRNEAKLRDRQNRLAYISELARGAAADEGDRSNARRLSENIQALERSRLATEDTLCHNSMTLAERKWMRVNRSAFARHWNLLTDLTTEQLRYVA